LIAAVALAGLLVSNRLYDQGIPHYVSRKLGHAIGGIAFLLCGRFFSTAVWPICLAAGFSLLLGGARLLRPLAFRGVGGGARGGHVLAEVWFPAVAIPVFGVGWYWLKLPAVAVACLLFMAWGDCVTGLVRFKVYGRPVKGIWGSLAMLVVCLAIAGFMIRPFWVGAVGAGIAVLSEWAFGDAGVIKWGDDNWAIPATSLAAIAGLMAALHILPV
jgi:hypothetical protein